MAVNVDAIHQDRVCRGYVCANCWGNLYPEFSGECTPTGAHIYHITCQTPGCPCRGFVSKYHVEATEFQAVQERYELWHDLKDVLPWVRQRGPSQRDESRWDPDTETNSTRDFNLAELNAQLGF